MEHNPDKRNDNIIVDVVGEAYYKDKTSHIKDAKDKTLIYRNNSGIMPGVEYMDRLTFLGDEKVSGHIAMQDDRGWDRESVFKHYLKGVKLKWDVAEKMGISDRTSQADCALGYKMQNHYFIDEFGTSLTQEKPFPAYIVEAATMYLKRASVEARQAVTGRGEYDAIDLDDYMNVKASYPRGKNTGLPWMVGGKDRFQNDLVLASNALLAALFVKGYSIDQVFRDLYVGYVVFSRYQRTGKDVPMYLDGACTSRNFEPRRRVINATPKAIAMAVKPLVKWWTVLSLDMPVYNQDRRVMLQRVKGAEAVFASDASRFDLRSGGVKLKQGIQILWDVAEHHHKSIPEGVYKTMMDEAFLPTLAMYGYPTSQLYESAESALRSGASTTSRVGSVINLMYDMMIESARIKSSDPKVISDYYYKYEPSMILGDDLLKTYTAENVKKYGAESSYVDKMKVLETVGMSAELETPTRFLGYLIEGKGGKAQLRHGTSPLDNMFFPERFSTNPTASMLMRYTILKEPDAMQALQLMAKIMQDGNFAMQRYTAMMKDIGPGLEAHYKDHPSGAGRVFYQMLASNPTVDKLKKSLYADLDSVLTFISKGSNYDFNYALIGLPQFNDIIAEQDDLVTGSLNQFVDQAVTVSKGAKIDASVTYNRDDLAWSTSLDSDRRKRQKTEDVLRLFAQKSEMDIINTFHTILPKVARRVATTKGDIYIGNL